MSFSSAPRLTPCWQQKGPAQGRECADSLCATHVAPEPRITRKGPGMGVLQGTVPSREAAPRRQARGLLGEEDPEHGAGCLATGDRHEDGPRAGEGDARGGRECVPKGQSGRETPFPAPRMPGPIEARCPVCAPFVCYTAKDARLASLRS